ncbi:MAG TPA: 16S rRNA (guanine(966)-N(2))-methyltransferase RsmD [Terriglobales bacterium]|jgi:16S rRNA (guanine966-N2)-methyltransferase|nr:16S rRNA (guanine(966)-N(2))-methyltransferase RsmD [Terriglobales bacterium]
MARQQPSMRVISGKFRSRPLRSLGGLEIRPTSDRLRETLFNVLTAGNREALAGSTWLDLFAGSGAVGIEALSRGARMVYFVESSKEGADLIAANLSSLGLKNGFEILRQEVSRALPALARKDIRPHFIFLDPPYKLRNAYSETLDCLGKSELGGLALVMVEHEKKFDPGEEFGELRRSRLLRQGDAALSFYGRT